MIRGLVFLVAPAVPSTRVGHAAAKRKPGTGYIHFRARRFKSVHRWLRPALCGLCKTERGTYTGVDHSMMNFEEVPVMMPMWLTIKLMLVDGWSVTTNYAQGWKLRQISAALEEVDPLPARRDLDC